MPHIPERPSEDDPKLLQAGPMPPKVVEVPGSYTLMVRLYSTTDYVTELHLEFQHEDLAGLKKLACEAAALVFNGISELA